MPLSIFADVLNSRYSPLAGFIAFAGIWALVIFYAIAGGDRGPDRYKQARDLYLSECKKPIEVCAAHWDDGRTLRQIYTERLTGN